jgi:poly(3-hydroxybutyrate) depolymerase
MLQRIISLTRLFREAAMSTRLAFLPVAVCCLLVSLPATAAEPLPAFNVDLGQTSVSGLSSGAYMAGQFHVAFSETVIGAGIVAGGPYDCAEGQLSTALNRCMETLIGFPDAARLIDRAEARAARGEIDPLSGLADDRVYVFAGTEDETVSPAVGAQVAVFYRNAGIPQGGLLVEDTFAAGHAFITEDQGNACGRTAAPYINDCDHDQAGMLLRHIYGPLEPPADRLGGTMIEFDQSEFLPDPTGHGMALSGFAYVPADCASGEPCRVHVAFHGCRQTQELVGDAFLSDTGYNRWADTNSLIVLYPQAHDTAQNPNACWDWWGYDDPGYATRSGRQMAAVRAMLTRLAGGSVPPPGSCEVFQGFNFAHWQAGRARICNWWFFCAVGSGEGLGFAANASTLYENPPGSFSTRPCAQ